MRKILLISLSSIFFGVFSLSQTVRAQTDSKNISVIYKNTTHISGADYLISVPIALKFSEVESKLDTTVTINNQDGSKYSGEYSVKIDVLSTNNYRLKHEDDFQEIKYTLVKYDQLENGVSITNDRTEVGVLNKNIKQIKGNAYLGSTAVADEKRGKYTDILKYVCSIV